MAATLKDISEKLKISVPTISKVLNGKGTVSQSTQELILATAIEMNYHPNQSARNLRTNNNRTIGVIVPNITNAFYAYLVKGIEEKCRNEDYSVILCNCNYDLEREKEYFELLRSKSVSGMILAAVGGMNRFDKQKEDIVVSINELRSSNNVFDCVSIDNRAAANALTQHLINLGHKNIAYIAGGLTDETPKLRLEGYVSCLENNNIEVDEKMIVKGGYGVDFGYKATQKLLLGKHLPSAIVCHNNFVAYGAFNALCQVNIDIPKDISLVCFDAIDDSDMMKIKFSCIMQPVEKIGYEAVDIIIEKNNGNIPTDRVVKKVMEFAFINGASVIKI